MAQDHLKGCIKGNDLLVGAKEDNVLEKVFTRLYSPVNFLHIFRYMKKLIDIDQSSGLGKYFCFPNAEVFQEVSIQCFKERDPQDVAEADSVEKAKKKEVSLSHLS